MRPHFVITNRFKSIYLEQTNPKMRIDYDKQNKSILIKTALERGLEVSKRTTKKKKNNVSSSRVR